MVPHRGGHVTEAELITGLPTATASTWALASRSVSVPGLTMEDRLGIDDLLTRYATAIDGRDWELLDTVFTDSAHLDYRSAGGVAGDYAEVKQWLAEVLPILGVTQHHIMNRFVRVDHGQVRSTSTFLNINVLTIKNAPWIFKVGGRYHDRLVVEGDTWQIAERIEDTLWWENPMPGLPPFPAPVDGLLDTVPH